MSLTDYEVGIILNLLNRGAYKNQDILGLINVVRRHEGGEDVNGGRISEVKSNNPRYSAIKPASDKDTDVFIQKASSLASHSVEPLDQTLLKKLFPLDKSTSGKLDITETDTIECKEKFGSKHLFDNCFTTIAAFANNKGGYIAFGVKDRTWELKGIDGDKFKDFDRKDLGQQLRNKLSCAIDFEMETLEVGGKTIGVLYVAPAKIKPVIAISNAKDGLIEGNIYYRYQAESRKIGFAELQKIIEERVQNLDKTTLNKHLSTILANGIENSAVLNINSGQVDGKAGSFLIDEDLIREISFIKEGEFKEKSGAPTLKIVGEVEKVAGVVKIGEELIESYPYAWADLKNAVKSRVPGAKQPTINQIIREYNLKSDRKYAAYNFRNNRQKEGYESSGKIPNGVPSIYNQAAVDFVAKKAAEKVAEKA